MIGRIIKTIRYIRNKKLTSLAKESGVSVSYMSLIESDQRNPSNEALDKISRSLDIPKELILVTSGMDVQCDRETLKTSKMLKAVLKSQEKLQTILHGE